MYRITMIFAALICGISFALIVTIADALSFIVVNQITMQLPPGLGFLLDSSVPVFCVATSSFFLVRVPLVHAVAFSFGCWAGRCLLWFATANKLIYSNSWVVIVTMLNEANIFAFGFFFLLLLARMRSGHWQFSTRNFLGISLVIAIMMGLLIFNSNIAVSQTFLLILLVSLIVVLLRNRFRKQRTNTFAHP
jgi:hypothetical protein